nr:hypothetical protein [Roseovarius spongiae]
MAPAIRYEKIGAAYDFVRNEIAFDYNRADDIPASKVPADWYGAGTDCLSALPIRWTGESTYVRICVGRVPHIPETERPNNIYKEASRAA